MIQGKRVIMIIYFLPVTYFLSLYFFYWGNWCEALDCNWMGSTFSSTAFPIDATSYFQSRVVGLLMCFPPAEEMMRPPKRIKRWSIFIDRKRYSKYVRPLLLRIANVLRSNIVYLWKLFRSKLMLAKAAR